VSDLFSDRLQRYLDGELSDEETLELFKQVAEDRAARLEFLEAKEMDLEFRRLLNPGGSDAAFIRGVLSSQSKERKDSSVLIRQVLHTYTEEKKRTAVKRGQFRIFALAAAGLLAIAALLAGLTAERSQQRSEPRQARIEEKPLVRPEPPPPPTREPQGASREPDRPNASAPEKDPKIEKPEGTPGPVAVDSFSGRGSGQAAGPGNPSVAEARPRHREALGGDRRSRYRLGRREDPRPGRSAGPVRPGSLRVGFARIRDGGVPRFHVPPSLAGDLDPVHFR
jgi:hypothetical protein